MAEAPARRATRTKTDYSIEIGLVRPPSVRDSIYPWDELREAAEEQALAEDPTQLVSFFVPCDDEDHANQSRSSIQSSGRNFYMKRGQRFNVVSSVVQEDDEHGVRSWVFRMSDAEVVGIETSGEE